LIGVSADWNHLRPNKGRTSAMSYSASDADSVAAPCSSLGPLRKVSTAACDSQLEDVDASGVGQVGGDGEVEAASCPACLLDDAHATGEVGLALLGLDGDASCKR
jgi:hypothetical protein